MRITFVLPQSGAKPGGGLKVVYEYANGLARKGHEVTVLHAPMKRVGERSLSRALRRAVVYTGRALGLKGGHRPDAWFELDPQVETLWAPTLAPRHVPRADAVVATAWESAEWVARYPVDRGARFYLIQHQEAMFDGADPERAMATWKLPLHKIVIARWLREIAEGLGEATSYVPNGLDFERFGLDVPIAERSPHRVLMLYQDLTWKGSQDGLAALRKVKERVPELKATLFGLPQPPEDLPDWITYERNPAQNRLRRLYNEAAVFLGPSWAEGWPLPPAEAMQCGAALCVTDIGGHREYALHEQNALLSPAKDPAALAANLETLLTDPARRIALATSGHAYIQRFTWERAVTTFEQVLRPGAASPVPTP